MTVRIVRLGPPLLIACSLALTGAGCSSSAETPPDAGKSFDAAGKPFHLPDAGRDGDKLVRDARGDTSRADHESGDATPDAYVPTAAETTEFAELVAFAQQELALAATPGVSIAVVLHGQLAFAAGVGDKNVEAAEPVTTSTVFRVGSMSKMIVAATAMTLVEDGKLDLAEPITTYVPWFTLQGGADSSGMTSARLLSHTSGFPADTIDQCGASTSGPRPAFFMDTPEPEWYPPGAAWVYSNTGFALEATVLEAAAGGGSTYEELAQTRIFAPTGMTTATFNAVAVEQGDYATGYDLNTDGTVAAVEIPTGFACPLLDPPGGVNATATDYAHFAEMLLANGGSVLKPSSVAAMEAPHADMHTWASQSYGYALITDDWPYLDHPAVWHDGEVPGYTSFLFTVPDLGFGVVVLANSSGGSPSYVTSEDIGNKAVGLFLPPPTNNGITVTTPESAWGGYVGTYDDPYGYLGAGVVVSIDTPDGGAASLNVSAPNAKSFDGTGSAAPFQGALVQADDDTWVLPPPASESVTFFPESDGGASGPSADGGTSGYFATRLGVAVRQ